MSRGSSKSETRNPKEGRNANAENRKIRELTRTSFWGFRRCMQPRQYSDFGFRPSFDLRPLVFGLLLRGLCLVAAQTARAATNLISSDEIPPLRPPRAELPPGFWERYGLAVIILSALLIVVLAIAVWFVTRPKPMALIPPATRARRELEPLANRVEDGAVLSRVSQELRHYVAAVFGLPQGEVTTAEFCRALISLEKMGPPLSIPLTDFLRECDRRKFAAGAVGPQPLGAVSRALCFIDACEARLAQLRQVAAGAAAKP